MMKTLILKEVVKFIFLVDNMKAFKLKFFIILSFKFFLILVPNNASSVSGSEINKKLQLWLLEKDIVSNPNFSTSKIYKQCK